MEDDKATTSAERPDEGFAEPKKEDEVDEVEEVESSPDVVTDESGSPQVQVVFGAVGVNAVHTLSMKAAKVSPVIADVLRQNPDSLDVIPIPTVEGQLGPCLVSFLENSAKEPILVIKRPLTSPDLTDAGVPTWADLWIREVVGSPKKVEDGVLTPADPKTVNVLDLWEAAEQLRLKMLKGLVEIYIGSVAIEVGAKRMKEFFPEIPQLTPEEERELKEKNPWGWKQATANLTADEQDEEDEDEESS